MPVYISVLRLAFLFSASNKIYQISLIYPPIKVFLMMALVWLLLISVAYVSYRLYDVRPQCTIVIVLRRWSYDDCLPRILVTPAQCRTLSYRLLDPS